MIDLGSSIPEDPCGGVIDEGIFELPKAQQALAEDQPVEAVRLLREAARQDELTAKDLQERAVQRHQAASLIELRITNGGHLVIG